MPHRKGSPEAKAWAESMKLKKANKSNQSSKQKPDPTPTLPADDSVTISRSDLDELRRQIQEIKSKIVPEAKSSQVPQPPQQSPQFNQQGSLIGVFEKYLVDPANYPSPAERLANEPRLQRFAFKENYHFVWQVSASEYQTIDGRRIREPKFQLELWANLFDDDGNMMKDKYLAKTFVWHEDPQAALAIAREQGIEVKEWDDSTIDLSQKNFLEEMRYLRIRDAILETFYPRPADASSRTREIVRDNRLGKVMEFSTPADETGSIPFDKLK